MISKFNLVTDFNNVERTKTFLNLEPVSLTTINCT